MEDERDVLERLVHGEEDGLAVQGEPPVHSDLYCPLAQLILGLKNVADPHWFWIRIQELRSMRIRLRIQDFNEQKFKKLHI